MKRFLVLAALLFSVSARAEQTPAEPRPIDPMVPVSDSPTNHNPANPEAAQRAAEVEGHAAEAHEAAPADAHAADNLEHSNAAHAEAAHGEHAAAAHDAHGAKSHGHGHGHGEPTVNWWKWDADAPPVGWYAINFVIFIALIVKFTKNKLAEAMQKRHETIKATIDENQNAYDAIKSKHDTYRGKLANVEQESRALIEGVKADGTLERDRIVKNAEEYAERMKADVKTVVSHEETRAAQRLQSEVAKAALADAEEMLRRGINDADRERLFEQSLQQIENAEESRPARRPKSGPAAVGGEA